MNHHNSNDNLSFITVASVVIVLFAFVPIFGLFTWIIPLFILNRIIPLQFYGFISDIPVIVWCTITSTIIVSITFLTGDLIEHYHSDSNLNCSNSLGTFAINRLRNKLSFSTLFIGACHLFGISMFCGFCSFIFCVSPSLYLCALFWFVYETTKTDMKMKDNLLTVRQHLYECCFQVFDEIGSQKTEYFKQLAYHIFSVMLTIQNISDETIIDPQILKQYLECLRNSMFLFDFCANGTCALL